MTSGNDDAAPVVAQFIPSERDMERINGGQPQMFQPSEGDLARAGVKAPGILGAGPGILGAGPTDSKSSKAPPPAKFVRPVFQPSAQDLPQNRHALHKAVTKAKPLFTPSTQAAKDLMKQREME